MFVDIKEYIRPDGRTRMAQLDIPATSKEDYESMQEHDCRLAAELLPDGDVSLTIENDEDDLDITIVMNGPPVVEGVVRLLKNRRWERLAS